MHAASGLSRGTWLATELREQNVGLDRPLDCPRMALLTFLSTMEFSEIASDMLRSHFEFSGG